MAAAVMPFSTTNQSHLFGGSSSGSDDHLAHLRRQHQEFVTERAKTSVVISTALHRVNGTSVGNVKESCHAPSNTLRTYTPVDYSIEENREKSFDMAPLKLKKIVTPLVLSGFYFTQEKDQVKCCACHAVLGDWNKSSATPHERHVSTNPSCRFLRGNGSPVELLQTDDASHTHKQVSSKNIHKAQRKYLGDMSLSANRKKTFLRFPKHITEKIKIDDIIDGGFFYAEEEESIICPICGIKKVVGELKSTLTPLEQHMSWSSNCKFVKDNHEVGERKENTESPKPSVKRWAWMKEDAVMAALDLGIEKNIVKQSAFTLKKDLGDNILDVGMLMDEIHRRQDLKSRFGQENIPKTEEPEELVILREKNRELRQRAFCHLCEKSVADLLMLPCKHLVSCESCGESVDECPKCDTHILATVKTFFG